MEINADRVRATKPRLGILIDLADLERLIERYLTTLEGDTCIERLAFSSFLEWLRQGKDKTNEQA